MDTHSLPATPGHLDTHSTHLCQKLGGSDEIFHFSLVVELWHGHTISMSYLQHYTDPISSGKSQHPSTRESLVEMHNLNVQM